MKTWNDKLLEWSSGKYLTYPNNIHKPFFYETTVCTKNLNTPYQEKFIIDSRLSLLKYNYSSFKKHI